MSLFRLLFTGLVVVQSACGGPMTVSQRAHQQESDGDYRAAVSGYLYELEKAPTDDAKERYRRDRDRAGAEWIRTEIRAAKVALEAGDTSKAFAILAVLSKAAGSWAITDKVAPDLQPAAAEVVIALVPKVATPELIASDPPGARRLVMPLIAMVDAAHDQPVRDKAAELFSAAIARESELSAQAASTGRPATAYFHRVQADAYAFKKRDTSVPDERAAQLDAIAGIEWQIETSTSCSSLTDGLERFQAKTRTRGRLVKLSAIVGDCRVDVDEEITQVEKTYYRETRAASSRVEKTDGYYERSETVHADGSTTSNGTTGHWVEGTSRTVNTEGAGETLTGTADVSTRTYHRKIHATLIATLDGQELSRSPVVVELTRQSSSWQIRGASGPGTSGTDDDPSSTRASEYRLEENERTKIESDIDAAVLAARGQLGQKIARSVMPGDTVAVLEAYLAGVRAASYMPSADISSTLETTYHQPPSEIVALIENGMLATSTNVPPPVDLTLAGFEVPKAEADADAVAGTNTRNGYIAARNPGGFPMFELGLTTTQAGSDAPMGTNKIGFGVGAVLGGRYDPGPDSGGVLFHLAADARLGYSNAAFFDFALPVALGFRAFGVGAQVLGHVGIDKYGDSTETRLYANAAPYSGYGARLSYSSTGTYDFSAAYLTIGRSSLFAESDELTLTDSERYEFRINRYTPDVRGGDPVFSLFVRYATFTGTRPGGHVASVWLSFGLL